MLTPQPPEKKTTSPAEAIETALLQSLESAVLNDLVDKTWHDLISAGTPLFDASSSTVTFLFRYSEATALTAQTGQTSQPASRGDNPDITGVYLFINRITDKEHVDHGLMRQVPGTDIWIRSVELSPSYRGSYGFRVLSEDQPFNARPPHNGYHTHPDPHSPHQLGATDGYGLSVVAGKHAPAQPHWDNRAPAARGTVLKSCLSAPDDDDKADLEVFGYFPTHLPPQQKTCGILTLFDAETWFSRLNLPTALESAFADKTPPFAVLGIANNTNSDRLRQLGGNAEFLELVGTRGLSWLKEQAAAHGLNIDPTLNVIAGQSLGGLSALYAGLLNPQRYSTIIAQSPSLWWSPEPGCTPRDLTLPTHGWITEKTYHSQTPPGHVIIDAGAREGAMVTKAHLLDMACASRGIDHELHVYDGGHDQAWWRGALLDHLSQLRLANNNIPTV